MANVGCLHILSGFTQCTYFSLHSIRQRHVPFFPQVLQKNNNNSSNNNNGITHNYYVDKKVYIMPSVLRNGALAS